MVTERVMLCTVVHRVVQFSRVVHSVPAVVWSVVCTPHHTRPEDQEDRGS